MSSIKGVQLQPAYILHARPFRETSLLLEVFSRDYGRVALIARGARGSRHSCSRFSSALQPFIPLLLSWRGRGALLNLTHAESSNMPPILAGRLLLGGWYMNELMIRTLGHWDAHDQLFIAYQTALYDLVKNFSLSLRQFEKRLLTTLGILPQLDYEKETGLPVQKERWYLFSPLHGVIPAKENQVGSVNCFQGDVLLAVQNEKWQHQAYWPSMKRLFRLVLDEVLMHQPIRSRDLL